MSEIKVQHRLLRHDVEVHVEDSGGDGRPVVLIHGWPMTSESWAPQVDVLTGAGYRVVAYDRRGFGRSDKPAGGYDYDTLADDLAAVLEELDLRDATLVGFSMGGGEVVRYISRHGEDRLCSVVLAGAVTPFMMHDDADTPEGPLTKQAAAQMAKDLLGDRKKFFDDFTTQFYSANGTLAVTEEQRQAAIVMCEQADENAAAQCMTAFGATDFRGDLPKVGVPTLVIHGDSDATVPFEGSGARTHRAIPQSQLVLVQGGPHGFTLSHADEFNAALLEFLAD